MKNKFRAVEVGIFSVVSLIFLNSVYNLFTDGRLLGSSERKPLVVQAPARSQPGEAGKNPSQDAVAGFVPYETKCQASGEILETTAAKVRILGPFCGAPIGRQIAGAPPPGSGSSESTLSDYKIENTTSRYTATVFSDHAAGKFSTDFIPLEPGTNKVIMEFRYRNGKVHPVELTIIRK